MALTTEQLLYINNLMYSKDPALYGNSDNPQTSYENRTLGELVDSISPAGNAESTASASEWARMVSEIKSDPQLMNLQIKDTYYDPNTGDARCLLVDRSTNEAVVAFKGTGIGEWKDNFIAGSTMDTGASDPTISVQQQKALDYVDGFDLSQYDIITVTGHSKGGNKAKACALLIDDVDRCVSFDGQGFSDEFMDAHASDIARNQGKIENHNLDGDFVNILLNDVGETTYYEGQRIGDNFPKNHDPSSFFDNSGNMIKGEQSPEMQDLDQFLNSLLRSTDQETKAELLDYAGEIADAAFGGGDIKEVLLDPRYTDEASYVLAYMLEYEHATGDITDALSGVMSQMGFEEFTGYVDVAQIVLGNEFLYNTLTGISKYADEVPDWVINVIRECAELNGKEIPLTNDEIRQILRIVAETGEKTDDIHIRPNSGDDIVIAGGSEPHNSGWSTEGLDLSGSIIFVQYAELMACYRELRQAVELYNDAVAEVKSAAGDLATKWMGDARDAFCADQQRAYQWYSGLAAIADAAAQSIMQAYNKYRDNEEKLKEIMRA